MKYESEIDVEDFVGLVLVLRLLVIVIAVDEGPAVARILVLLLVLVFLLVLYLLISTLCFAVLRGTLMGNANALGSSVTSAYAQEIDGINALRESFVAFAASSIDQRVGEGWSGEQIDIWAQRFFQQAHLQDEGAHYLLSYGDVTVTAEGAVDGRVTAPWYDLAISGGGDIVYSPVYIDPATGRVEGIVDLTGLLPAGEYTPTTDVLNGIAWDAEGRRLFVTGKNWSKLFEIEIIEQ